MAALRAFNRQNDRQGNRKNCRKQCNESGIGKASLTALVSGKPHNVAFRTSLEFPFVPTLRTRLSKKNPQSNRSEN